MGKAHRRVRLGLAACFAAVLLAAPSAQRRTPERLVAIADVHGAYPQLVAVLQRAGLVDARLNWAGGSTVLVQTGDVIDRGGQSRACLDLLMTLETQAPRKGGAVIPLLGNHEVLNLIGQLAYVTPEIFKTFADSGSEKRRTQAYAEYVTFLTAHAGHGHTLAPPADERERTAWMDAHPPGFVEHRDAFGPKGKYGRWIRTHHALVQIGGGVFLHGGLSPSFPARSIAQVDARVMAELPVFDAVWQRLVDAHVIWRNMTLPEAAQFAREDAAWLSASGRADEPVVQTITQLGDVDHWMVSLDPDGPLWYRGLAEAPDAPDAPSADAITAMLSRLGVQYMVVGHTPQDSGAITPAFGGRVFLLDTGMLPSVYDGRATALEIRSGRFTALSSDRAPEALPAPQAQ